MNTTKTFFIKQLHEWKDVIPAILHLAAGRKIWLLNGHLGAGKTTFTKRLLQHLGSPNLVDSPTFSLINTYRWNDESGEQIVYHLDLYRLESTDEVLDIGLDEIIDSGNLVLIEWPEVALPILPEDCLTVDITVEEGHRKIIVL